MSEHNGGTAPKLPSPFAFARLADPLTLSTLVHSFALPIESEPQLRLLPLAGEGPGLRKMTGR
jgi:hypothetical protein